MNPVDAATQTNHASDAPTRAPEAVEPDVQVDDPDVAAVEPAIVSLSDALVDVDPNEKPVVVQPAKLKGMQRFEAFIERLSANSTFWQNVCSRIWMPFAYYSGLQMKKVDQNSFTCVLPFRRFNRNWYRAMAGAALVGNSELAAGMYLFGTLGGQWTVVCKELSYKFMRPCFGPAIYQVNPVQDIQALLARGNEFNIDLVLDVVQQMKNRGRVRRVGRCEATFHCTPKDKFGNRGMLVRDMRKS